MAAIRTTARHDGDDYVIGGQKMWITNGASANLVALLARTPAGARSDSGRAHRDLTAFLIEKPSGFGQTRPGLTIPGKMGKMGYKGVGTSDLILDDCRVPADRGLGDRPGRGFYQMMDGIEVGRVNVAAGPAGSRTAPSSWPSATLSSGRRSASPSRSTRRSSSSWPRWEPRWWPPTR